MVPRWWPAAPDVIWHIYSHLHCSMGDGGRELRSSGEAALTMGQVPCEFWTDWPRFSFLGEAELRGFPAYPYWGCASTMASGSGCDLAHLLMPGLLLACSCSTRQVNMLQAYYSLHEHCILKILCMGHWQKGVPPFKNKFHDHLFW